MSVRAKFTVQSITRQQGSKYVPETKNYVTCELQVVKLQAVYDSNPESENGKFWAATPSGNVELSMINAATGDYFELGEEYFLDFTKVSN